MVQNEVDARPRDQDREALQEFDGIEHEVRRAIRPRVPELQDDLPLRGEAEPVLRHRQSQGVPTELLETLSIVGGDPHARVEVKPILPGVTARRRQGCVLPRRRAVSPDGPARPDAQRKGALYRRRRKAGQYRHVFRSAIRRARVLVAQRWFRVTFAWTSRQRRSIRFASGE